MLNQNLPRLAVRVVVRTIVCLALGISAWLPAAAQVAESRSASASDEVGIEAVAPVTRARILSPISETNLVKLNGNTHPLARPEFDKGVVDPQMLMEHMTLVLRRSPEQEAALTKFMDEQLDPKSSNFHHWLKPEEFGALYGPSEYDIQSVTTWLQNEGFRIDQVTKGRTFIKFSGTAGQVLHSFHTEIHHFAVGGEEHVANSHDPSIPAAIAPVVIGIQSLHNFFAKPLHKYLGDFKRDNETRKWIPLDPTIGTRPEFVIPSSSPTFELISPTDFATIYNVGPLWSAGIDGTGQTIAIAGRSDVSLADVQAFRSSFGLPANDPVFIVNGTDPGVPSANDKVENTLDVEWSGAVAKKATIKFVTTASTQTSDGAAESAIYIVDNVTAPVMSFSYGACELAFGTGGNAFYNSLWQQGAAEGISEFVASGDQGSAACDGGGTAPTGADSGLAVSGSSTTPYNIAIGGTDFDWVNLSGTYWSATNNATTGANALGYIPEVTWNGTCASAAVDLYIGFTAAGFDAEQACQYELTNSFDIQDVSVSGGTGGVSKCTAPTGTTPATCAGGYAKPSWQKGTGVPADGKRDVPDLSLFAASGSLFDAYAICDSQTAPCTYSNTNDAYSQAVGGTSVASPAMAGIMALINQKMGTPQGNANVGFYALAALDNRTSCNTNTVASGNACNFYDVTTDNNAVPCIPGSLNCNVIHSGDGVGILSGYSSTVGFDLTTGLGTVNAKNLVNNWASVSGGTPTITLTPTSLTFASTAEGSTTAAQVITIKNTGTAAATLTSETLTGANASSYLISANTCTASLAAAATCTVSIEFKPVATGTLTASLSVADNASGSPHTATLTGSGTASPTLSISLSPTTLTFASTPVGSTTAAQVVTVSNTGTSAVTLTSETLTGTNASAFLISTKTCGASLAASATCTVSIEFKPTATGAATASLSVADNATGSPQTVALSGTGAAASTFTVTLLPASLSFPSTTVGQTSATQNVTLTNTGSGTVNITSKTVTGTNPASFIIATTTCGTTLAAGASCTLTMEFKPVPTGNLSANLSIADNATGSPQLVTMTGTSVAVPTFTVSLTPTTLTFASTPMGSTSAAQNVTIKNTGTGVVNLTSETLTGTNAGSYLISANTCGASLAASATCVVSIQFKPTATGTLTASLSVADNATGSPQAVSITGTGAAASTLAVSVTPATLTFASTAQGVTTAAQVVTVKNTGTAAVTLTSETITGANATSFLKSATTCGASLAASATCTVSVEFSPQATGALSASLSVADNASGSPQTVALSGTGTAAGSAALTLTPASLTFPATIVGTTSDVLSVNLKNTGTSTLNLTSIALAGTNPAAFEYLTGCGTTLAAGANCNLFVGFKPTAVGATSATISITDNATGSPQMVTLSGTGAGAPTVKLSATSIAFPATVHGTTSAVKSFSVTNSGTAVLTISSISLTGANPTDFVELDNCPATLAANGVCTVYVAFTPASAASFTATVTIVDNGSASPQTVTLTGSGT